MAPAPSELPPYRGCRYPAEIISYAAWLYYRFSLSLRDVEDEVEEGWRFIFNADCSECPASVLDPLGPLAFPLD